MKNNVVIFINFAVIVTHIQIRRKKYFRLSDASTANLVLLFLSFLKFLCVHLYFLKLQSHGSMINATYFGHLSISINSLWWSSFSDHIIPSQVIKWIPYCWAQMPFSVFQNHEWCCWFTQAKWGSNANWFFFRKAVWIYTVFLSIVGGTVFSYLYPHCVFIIL